MKASPRRPCKEYWKYPENILALLFIIMYLSDLIEQLTKAEETVSNDCKVFLQIWNQEVPVSSISMRFIDIDEYEIVLE